MCNFLSYHTYVYNKSDKTEYTKIVTKQMYHTRRHYVCFCYVYVRFLSIGFCMNSISGALLLFLPCKPSQHMFK